MCDALLPHSRPRPIFASSQESTVRGRCTSPRTSGQSRLGPREFGEDASERTAFRSVEERLERRLSPSTLKCIAAHHDAVDGRSLGKHNLIVRFLSGARRINPLCPLGTSLLSWLDSVKLKFLSAKTALLTALTSIKKIGDLQAFSVSEECLVFGPVYSSRIRAQGSNHALLRSGGEPASTALGGGRSSISVAVSHKSIGPHPELQKL